MTGVARATAVGAVAMTGVLACLRLGLVGGQAPTSANGLIPLLIAVAFLCVVGLARGRHPSIAWLATIGAAFTVTIDLAGYALAVGLKVGVDETAWRLLGIAVSVAALIAVGAAAGYAASRPRLRRRWVTVVGVAALGLVGIAAGWALANPADLTFVETSALGSLALVTRSCIVLASALTLLGLAGDVLPAVERARHRSAAELPSTAPQRARLGAWLRAFVDELSPGRGRARRAVLAERTRVARDIHADVVPELRRVLADAERGVPANLLAASLREVLDDVEAVGAVQHPIQLEIGGLVAALEWLAERVESRSDVAVILEVADPRTESVGEPPRDVAAAAFRIAALALENVARHAPGRTAVVEVRAEAAAVAVSITDDGPGIGGEALAAAREAGRRGLADIASEADECGGVVEIGPGPGRMGTRVAFHWSAAGG